MGRWRVRIPFHSRDEALDADAVLSLPRALDDPGERAVASAVLQGALMDRLRGNGNAETVGDVLGQIEDATPEQRREIIDNARQRSGLPTVGEVEEAEARAPRVIGYFRGAPVTFEDRRDMRD